MSVDASDRHIQEVYGLFCQDHSSTNWLTCGYDEGHRGGDKLLLAGSGRGGLKELVHISRSAGAEARFGLLKLDGKVLLVTILPESVSGVKRAKALVHSRALGSVFKDHDASITVSRADELTLSTVRNKLRLDGSSQPASPNPASPNPASPLGRSMSTFSTQGPQSPNHSPSPSSGFAERSSSPTARRSGLAPPITTGYNGLGPAVTSGSPVASPSRGKGSVPSSPVVREARHSGDLPEPRRSAEDPPTNGQSGLSREVGAPAPPSKEDAEARRQAELAQAKAELAEAERQKAAALAQQQAVEAEAERQRALAEEAALLEAKQRELAAQRDAAERQRLAEEQERQRKEREEAERLERERVEKEKAERLERQRLEREREAREEAERQAAIEQARREKAAAKQAELDGLTTRFSSLSTQQDAIILRGHVNVQGGASIFWKRRWFELHPASLALYKSETDKHEHVDSIQLRGRVRQIAEAPEEVAIPNSFAVRFRDFDEEPIYLYSESADDKDLLKHALRLAAGL